LDYGRRRTDFKTTDGENKLDIANKPIGYGYTLNSVQFSGSSGLIEELVGRFSKPQMEESSWSIQSAGGTTQNINALFFMDSSTGWARL